MKRVRNKHEKQVHRRILRAVNQEKFYEILGGCGPFDGGCLPVAIALQEVLGGNLFAVRRNDGSGGDQHVLLQWKPGLFVDASGVRTEEEVFQYWQEVEKQAWKSIAPAHLAPTTLQFAAQSCAWESTWAAPHATAYQLAVHFRSYLDHKAIAVSDAAAPPKPQLQVVPYADGVNNYITISDDDGEGVAVLYEEIDSVVAQLLRGKEAIAQALSTINQQEASQ